MTRSQIIFGLLCSMAYLSYAAKPLFDPTKCLNGCQTDGQCPKNARCSLLNDGGTCGFCICDDGFKGQGGKCNAIKGYSTTQSTTASTSTETSTTTTTETTTSTTPTTSTSTTPTTTGTTTQGPPPSPIPVTCSDYDCTAAPPGQTNSNPSCKRELYIPWRKCNVKDGGQCYGMYCLTVTAGNDYCICPDYRVDRLCVVDKPGSCAQATGQVPAGYAQLQGRRYRNQANKDNGNIYGRHFASSLTDCIKLCQWSQGACRAVNFGPISGTNVCEMLSTVATEKNLLASWLEKADGWQYVQLAPAT